MGSSRMREMSLPMVVLVVVLVLFHLLPANGQGQPPQCTFSPNPPCPPTPTGLGHIVLVHGAGQGQWYWYKVKPILEATGYNVTTVQLGPSVTLAFDSIENVTFWSYSKPLFDIMECIDHKVLLVGHSVGGLSIAVAMEMYPQKTHGGVFIAAYMPDTTHPVSYVLDMGDQYEQEWYDTCIKTSGLNETWYFFGEQFLSNRLYQMCPPEDIELMSTQRRPGSFFNNELARIQLTKENYGSIDRFYIVTEDDLATYPEFQLQMIKNYPVKEVKTTKRSGHEVMLSKPLELSTHIIDIARQYPSYFGSANAAKDTTWVEKRTVLNSVRRGAWWA